MTTASEMFLPDKASSFHGIGIMTTATSLSAEHDSD
jgi:hypothetical protein